MKVDVFSSKETVRMVTKQTASQFHVQFLGLLVEVKIIFLRRIDFYECRQTIDEYTGKLDHLPLVVVEAELGQVWPFCCWYSPTE